MDMVHAEDMGPNRCCLPVCNLLCVCSLLLDANSCRRCGLSFNVVLSRPVWVAISDFLTSCGRDSDTRFESFLRNSPIANSPGNSSKSIRSSVDCSQIMLSSIASLRMGRMPSLCQSLEKCRRSNSGAETEAGGQTKSRQHRSNPENVVSSKRMHVQLTILSVGW